MPTILPIGQLVQYIDAAPPPASYDPLQYVVRVGHYWLDITDGNRPLLYSCISSVPSQLLWVRLNDLGGDYKDNIFIGKAAGLAISSGANGDRNVAIGNGAMAAATSAYQSVAIGYRALYRQVANNNNTAIGYLALGESTTGTANTAVGAAALSALTTGNGNVGVGVTALTALTTGANNVAIGNLSGFSITVEANNTMIGNGADVASGVSRSIALGAGARATANGQIALGSGTAPLTYSGTAGPIIAYLNLIVNGNTLCKLALHDL